MTVAGWIIFAVLTVLIVIVVAAVSIESDSATAKSIAIIVGIGVVLALLAGMHWYFKNTASGQRAIKTQDSNFNRGIERTVKVFDATGNQIAEYDGKFDLTYDDDRIVFDDQNDKRHIIFYSTGTVVIDEK